MLTSRHQLHVVDVPITVVLLTDENMWVRQR